MSKSLILCTLYGAIFGVVLDGALPRLIENSPNLPTPLTPIERSGIQEQKTFPISITLKILSEKDFEKIKTRPDVIAQTDIYGCTIYIPENWSIMYVAEGGTAIWKDPDNGETLAHEILHCLRGRWHPSWSEIKGY